MRSAKCGFYNVPGGLPAVDLLVQWGPTLYIDIGFDPNYRYSPGGPIPISAIQGLRALVDTGATESCVDSTLAGMLNLPIVDKRVTAGAHGAKEVSMHLAQIHIPSLQFTIYGAFAAVDLHAGGQVHSALLGRTFLQRFKMVYGGNTGSVEISD
jgi:predicted aspartyl protease